MTTSLRLLGFACLFALTASTASAQTAQQPSSPSDNATRPAITTSVGDTGLWYVPTAEVRARGKSA